MIRLRYLTLSVLAVLVLISLVPTVLSESPDVDPGDFTVPNWVKNTAGWWASDQIPDSAFLQGIQFLIKEKIIIVQIPDVDSEVVEEVPGWVKNAAGWWAEDKIHDVTFVAAIKYLISQGIITVEQEVPEVEEPVVEVVEVEEPVEEVVEIKDFYMEINSSNCCVNWAYVNEEYRFEIATLDKKRGNYIDGVEINVKIISKGGELRQNLGAVTTEDGIYKSSITIPSIDWYAENILYVTGTYYGVEKTIEKEFEVFVKKSGKSSCRTVNPFSLSSWETAPTSIAFSTGGNNSGSKMFVIGTTGDDVNEFALSIPYCLSTASFVDSFDISGQETLVQGIAFSPDGTKMLIAGQHGIDVSEYTLSTAWDVSTATFVSGECDLTVDSSGITKPRAIDFNSDGTKMRVITSNTDDVHEYTLTTGFDMSTCAYTADADLSVKAKDGNPRGMAFNSDGTKLFFVGKTNGKVHEYTLSAAYDVSTATYVDALDISSHEADSSGLTFDKNGYRMYIVGQDGIEINEYYLTVAWDISTASYK